MKLPIKYPMRKIMNHRTDCLVLGLALFLAAEGRAFGEEFENAIVFQGEEYPVTIKNVHEWRHQEEIGGSCSLLVEFEAFSADWELTEFELEKAVDDTGKDLVKDKVTKINRPYTSNPENAKNQMTIRLKQSAREAKEIDEIHGTLSVQNQRESARDRGKSIIRNFRSKPGEYLKNARLKRHGIEVAYISAESLDGKGGEIYLDAVAPNFSELGISDEQKRAPANVMKGLLSNPLMTMILVKDPEENVLKIDGVDSRSGVSIRTIPSSNGMFLLVSAPTAGSEEEAPVIDELHVYIKNEKYVDQAELTLRKIALP